MTSRFLPNFLPRFAMLLLLHLERPMLLLLLHLERPMLLLRLHLERPMLLLLLHSERPMFLLLYLSDSAMMAHQSETPPSILIDLTDSGIPQLHLSGTLDLSQ